jgi:hypothetical protein
MRRPAWQASREGLGHSSGQNAASVAGTMLGRHPAGLLWVVRKGRGNEAYLLMALCLMLCCFDQTMP